MSTTPIDYHSDIHERFTAARLRDKEMFKHEWLTQWSYQDTRQRRGMRYDQDQVNDFEIYNGPTDLIKWLNWHLDQQMPSFFHMHQISELLAASRLFDSRILKYSNLSWNEEVYDECIGTKNVQDYMFGHHFPHPFDPSDFTVLDFGAGYGRQANLWTSLHSNITYIGMDAIPKSYCLQHLYYAHSKKLMYDYVIDGPSRLPDYKAPGIYHLPTWRFDLIPEQSVDKILAVQVMPELSAKLIKHLVSEFHRVLKPTGILYLCDHGSRWRPGHRLDLNATLQASGFIREFKGHVVDGQDMIGIPRIWCKRRAGADDTERPTIRQRIFETFIDLDARSHGRLKRVYKKIF